jgi:hypothetical protein
MQGPGTRARAEWGGGQSRMEGGQDRGRRKD